MKQIRYKNGFTIVELVVVIAVIGILATLGLVGWRAWQEGIAKKQAQSDLKQASTAMENAKNFGSGYPGSIPSSFKSGGGVTVTYVSGDNGSYCIEAQSTKYPTVRYYINSASGTTPKSGTCAGGSGIAAPAFGSGSSMDGTYLYVTWNTVSGASSYEVQWRNGTGAWTTVTRTQTNYSRTGSVGTQTDFQVRTVGSDGTRSSWSSTKSFTPFAGPTSISVCAGNGGNSAAWQAPGSTQVPTFFIRNESGVEHTQTNNLTGTGTYWTTDQELALDQGGYIWLQFVNTQGDKSTAFEDYIPIDQQQWPCNE